MNLKSKFYSIFCIIFLQYVLGITFMIIEYENKKDGCLFFWVYFLIDAVVKFICLLYPIIVLKNGLQVNRYFILGIFTEISLYLSNLIHPFVLVINFSLPSITCDDNIIIFNAIFSTLCSILYFNLFKKTIKRDYQELRECVICLDNISLSRSETRLTCGHYFHTDCILEWGIKQPKCPVCRHEFSVFIN